ncbi:NineTeen Complex (NTC) component [Serendipita sp. 399]|nr:NineTeen Complex (NTC) component [Serendipita sp. 399]
MLHDNELSVRVVKEWMASVDFLPPPPRARNEEKAQSMLYRFREAQAAELGLGTRSDKRPRMASSCKSLRECERWRGEILREISRKVSKIQDAGLSDFEVRDLNDEINKLMREKRHWENQIIALGGANYRRNVAMLDADGKEVPGTKGYKYFGRAKELPGVKELFESKTKEEDEDKATAEFYKKFTNNGPDYYGDLDEADGELLEFEKRAELDEYREAVESLKEVFHLVDESKLPSFRDKDVKPINSSAANRKDENGDQVMDDQEATNGDSATSFIPFLTPEQLAPPKLPTKQEMDTILLELRKRTLLQEYLGDA